MRRAWIAIALSAGCQGVIGDAAQPGLPATEVPSPTEPTLPPAGTRARKRIDHPCGATTAAAAPLRRLTRAQYDHAIRDLFAPADVGRYGDRFAGDARTASFATNNSAGISDAHYEAYLAAAEAIAPIAVRDRASYFTCDEAAGPRRCARTFITELGRRAFRRPLESEEHARFVALYDAEVARGDHAAGLERVIEALLQSPSFLYRSEPSRALDNFALASRLSFLLWDSIPDDALLDAAERGELTDPATLELHARAMLASDRARDANASFFLQWLGMAEPIPAKDHPDWSDALGARLRDDTAAFADRVMRIDGGRFDTMLLGENGLLLQPGLLATHAHRNQTSPVQRGKLIREGFLCAAMPPPPPTVNDNPPDLDPNLTTRERFSEHDKNPECAGCHQLMDPIGLGFEGYDELGRRRDVEGGRPIDESGKIVATADIDGTFNGVRELSERLAASVQVKECVVDNWFTYTFGRAPEERDLCALLELDEVFQGTSLDVRELIVAITQSTAFRERSAGAP